jgi:acetyl-CoA carboxylase biotin carboxyl carrier protein
MSQFDVDIDLIRKLAGLLEETGLSEIELSDGERRVRVARGGVTIAAAAAAPVQEPAPEVEETAPPIDASHPGAITAPMVGTLYTAPEPGTPMFVNVGDTVSDGQTLFIIEAMKVMNPIRAPRAGTVSQILVSNGDPVEFGEVLLILE